MAWEPDELGTIEAFCLGGPSNIQGFIEESSGTDLRSVAFSQEVDFIFRSPFSVPTGRCVDGHSAWDNVALLEELAAGEESSAIDTGGTGPTELVPSPSATPRRMSVRHAGRLKHDSTERAILRKKQIQEGSNVEMSWNQGTSYKRLDNGAYCKGRRASILSKLRKKSASCGVPFLFLLEGVLMGTVRRIMLRCWRSWQLLKNLAR